MQRITPLTRVNTIPAKASSLLAKSAQLENVRSAAAAAQEILDIIMKSDTFSN